MHTKLLIAVAAIALLAGVFLLSGCPKQSADLQGAPPEGQHMMPGGKMMSDDQMKPPAPSPATAAGQDEVASCLVLGTTMPKKDMIAYQYQGKTYYFCCQACVDQFKQDPEKWIQHPATPKPMGEPMEH